VDKYVDLAKQLGMTDAILISPQDIYFDIRAILKCCWGCERASQVDIRCDDRNTTFRERVEMVKQYKDILLLHSHDAYQLSHTLLKLERIAFMDGYYFAFTLRSCNLCKECKVGKGEECSFPEKVRPCDQLFGIDVYRTVRQLGLPCDVLQSKKDMQNRYGFLLIN